MKQTNNTNKVHAGAVKLAIQNGITDNADLITCFKALTSADKLRGVKRSITVASQNRTAKAKPRKAAAKVTTKAKAVKGKRASR